MPRVSCKEGCVDFSSSIFIVLTMSGGNRDEEEKVLATKVFSSYWEKLICKLVSKP